SARRGRASRAHPKRTRRTEVRNAARAWVRGAHWHFPSGPPEGRGAPQVQLERVRRRKERPAELPSGALVRRGGGRLVLPSGGAAPMQAGRLRPNARGRAERGPSSVPVRVPAALQEAPKSSFGG